MDELPLPGARWSHLRWLLLLLVVAAGLRAWQITHTEVATRDSIAYTRYAWRLGVEPFTHVAQTSEHHPGYPILVYLASIPVRDAVPDDLPYAMQLSAQLASCLAGILLVVPMYLFGCELFDRRISFWATLLFQVLPASGRLMPDGLSEPVFLLFAATSLFAACRAIRTGRLLWFTLAGLSSGLAYLTRTEGLILAAVTGLVLLLGQLRRQTKRSWTRVVLSGSVLTFAALVMAAPFMLLIDGISAKPGVKNVIMQPAGQAAVSTPLPLAVWNFDQGVRPEDRYGWAAWAVVAMIDKAFFHVLTLPFVVGLLFTWRRSRDNPAAWVPLTLMAVMLPLLYRLGQSNGYLGERHVMLIALCGIFWAVAALAIGAAKIARVRPGYPVAPLTIGLFVALTLFPLPKTLARLHGERQGFRLAGEWLAANAAPEDLIYDPFSWSSYYAGRTFVRGQKGQPTPEDYTLRGKHFTCYVVLDESRSEHRHLWYLLEPVSRIAKQGKEVKRFETGSGSRAGAVVIYRIEG